VLDAAGPEHFDAYRAAIESSAHVMNFFNRLSNLLVVPFERDAGQA